jgi:CheY-like chemotaxis protein
MGTRRVLLIDDEDDIREVTQLSLEMVANWEVISAKSGAEGILRAVADQPDAILLDVMMPDMDGPTTFTRLRANPATRHIPVILLTATKMQGSGQATLDVAAVIPKPFDPMRLPGQIASALGWAA